MRERKMEGAKEEEARVSIEALSGGGEAGWGLLRGWARVCRGTWETSTGEEGEGGGSMEVVEEGRAEKVWALALALPGGERDPPEGEGVRPWWPTTAPGTTAMRFAPPESMERRVVGFVEAYDLKVRWVGA